ncbi:sigma factor [Chryseobacterium sp. NKUCC03_KSP]|uniref:RNA polymerase sigma factor n=1 Tax=Chryseobacterium sp. NKUCC03_KSP TaxID=2842125 RepID=UPI001C5B769E|nr:hypothetical protein [Chryseobacterium sp. NKUCC03_KSP]
MKNKVAEIGFDNDLCSLIKLNKKEGFDILYDQYSGILFGIAFAALRSNTYAEEVVQLTFIRVWNSIELYKCQQSFHIWIIQLLIISSKEFLDSKNVTYTFNYTHFPQFSFDFAP